MTSLLSFVVKVVVGVLVVIDFFIFFSHPIEN